MHQVPLAFIVTSYVRYNRLDSMLLCSKGRICIGEVASDINVGSICKGPDSSPSLGAPARNSLTYATQLAMTATTTAVATNAADVDSSRNADAASTLNPGIDLATALADGDGASDGAGEGVGTDFQLVQPHPAVCNDEGSWQVDLTSASIIAVNSSPDAVRKCSHAATKQSGSSTCKFFAIANMADDIPPITARIKVKISFINSWVHDSITQEGIRSIPGIETWEQTRAPGFGCDAASDEHSMRLLKVSRPSADVNTDNAMAHVGPNKDMPDGRHQSVELGSGYSSWKGPGPHGHSWPILAGSSLTSAGFVQTAPMMDPYESVTGMSSFDWHTCKP
jgi:hypothetical protein